MEFVLKLNKTTITSKISNTLDYKDDKETFISELNYYSSNMKNVSFDVISEYNLNYFAGILPKIDNVCFFFNNLNDIKKISNYYDNFALLTSNKLCDTQKILNYKTIVSSIDKYNYDCVFIDSHYKYTTTVKNLLLSLLILNDNGKIIFRLNFNDTKYCDLVYFCLNFFIVSFIKLDDSMYDDYIYLECFNKNKFNKYREYFLETILKMNDGGILVLNRDRLPCFYYNKVIYYKILSDSMVLNKL